MSTFQQLVDELLEFTWRSSPFSATYAGIHKYDHEMENVDIDFLTDVNRNRKDFLKRFQALNKNDLTGDECVDWQLLQNFLKSSIHSFEEIRHWQTNAAEYADLCISGLFILYVREFAPIEERATAILSRMQQIPRFLKDSKHNLKDAPEVFTKLAIEINEGGKDFLKTIVAQLSNAVPKLARDLENAGREASTALDTYGKFLNEVLLPKSKGEFAIGSDHFDFKLKMDHMLPYTAEEILAYGREMKKSTEEALEDIAQKIDKQRTWVEVVDAIKGEHPKADQLLTTYQREMERAQRFVQDRDLVSIPEDEELEVIPTPAFLIPILPYAAYMSPAPFEKMQKGYFFVTPVNDNIPAEKQEEILRGHSIYGIPVTALHEGYPGHHLQLVHANKLKNKLRRLLGTAVFVEGWALYCEEMMREAGFFSDPRARLLQLKDQLWRACRVIIDVELHAGRMGYEQAVELLVNDAKLQKVHAEKEVTRYTFTATQPMSYLVGKKQILQLKNDYQKKLGDKFQLRDFHNRLLSFGSIPVCLIRKTLGL
ncbi:DUF885 domain-containing protein [candidate division WOR-3 bacterium]|nr:DUF885 domain-containing protein [candidate division WOR-3 bacterium]